MVGDGTVDEAGPSEMAQVSTGKLQLEHTLQGHEDVVWDLSWNPAGTHFVSCSSDKTVRIWGLIAGIWKCTAVLDGAHLRTVRGVQWSHCGRFICTSSFDGTTCVWQQDNGAFECIATLEGHENEVKCAHFAPSGTMLATCSRDKSVWVWEVQGDDDFECMSVLKNHTQDVKCIRWHPSSTMMVSASYDNLINVYQLDEDDWYGAASLEGHTSTVWSMCFDTDGNRLVSVSDDKSVRFWKYSNGSWSEDRVIEQVHERAIYSVSWSPVNSRIATASGDNSICLFEEDGTAVSQHIPEAHTRDINCVEWNPKNNTLISASDDNTIKVWKLVT